jgi:hypothetical protein
MTLALMSWTMMSWTLMTLALITTAMEVTLASTAMSMIEHPADLPIATPATHWFRSRLAYRRYSLSEPYSLLRFLFEV